MKIKVRVVILTPRVPNFLQQDNGVWLPLCALDEEGLDELGRAFTHDLKARAKEQLKDKEKFYSMANRGEVKPE